jgi:HSP90 family molecular chaperone
MYEQAALAEGTQLSNPPEYVARLNRVLVRLAGSRGAPA